MTDSQIDALIDIFTERMRKVTAEYYKRMGRQVREIGEIIPSAQTRLVQIRRMVENIEYIQRMISEAANASLEDIARIFEAISDENDRFAQAYFGQGMNRDALMQSVRAQLEVTAGEMANLSRTTVVSSIYRDVIDRGIQAAQAGVEDYKSAMRRALREAAEDGLRVVRPGVDEVSPRVRYASGRTLRLDSAVRQNVLDGIRALNQANMAAIGSTFGADGVEISAHPMCAEDHLPYQGRQFSNAAFAELQKRLPRPIGMWNCRHIAYPILLGVNPPAHSAQELEEYRSGSTEQIEIDGDTHTRYGWTQVQRAIETAVRYKQDEITLAKAADDDVLVRDARRKIRELNSYYTKISEAAGTPRRRKRMGTYYGKKR